VRKKFAIPTFGGVTKREMKSAGYLYVVYPGFLYSFFDD